MSVTRAVSDGSPVDVLIITAADGEDDAVRGVGDDPDMWRKADGPLDFPLDLWRADFPVAGGQALHVALARALHMGSDNAATAAGVLAEHFRPRCLAMCGVCAGRPGWTNLSDVIIADRVYRYDVGELLNPKPGGTPQFSADMVAYPFRAQWKQPAERMVVCKSARWISQRPLPRTHQAEWVLRELHAGRNPSLSPDRKHRCADWIEVVETLQKDGLIEMDAAGAPRLSAAGQKRVQTILFQHPDGIPELPPFRIQVGPLGTGSSLIRDVDIWDRLASDQRLLRGFDMEASVIGLAGHMREIPWIVAKGVMDFAEPGRGQGFRKFAATAAAEILIAFLRENYDSLGPAQSRPPAHGGGSGNKIATNGGVVADNIIGSTIVIGNGNNLRKGKQGG